MAMVDEKWGRNQQVAAYDSFAILRPKCVSECVDLAMSPAGQGDGLIGEGGEIRGLGGIGTHQVSDAGTLLKQVDARGPLGLDG